MAEIRVNRDSVVPYEKVREYIRIDKYLGGLIKVERVVRTDRLGDELHIITAHIPEKVYLNGAEVEWVRKQRSVRANRQTSQKASSP